VISVPLWFNQAAPNEAELFNHFRHRGHRGAGTQRDVIVGIARHLAGAGRFGTYLDSCESVPCV